MSKKPGISVCFVIKNGLVNGYPFWESLLSCCSFADEIVISEGYSRDRTYDALKVFQERHPNKVKLFRTNWDRFRSGCGEVIAKVSSEAISKCSRQWVYYLQADEIIHEKNIEFIRNIPSSKFNSVKFMFAHFIGSWKPLPVGGAAYSSAIRMVRNIPAISMVGDGWTFQGKIDPICPKELCPMPIFHLGWVFPKNIDLKNLEQAKIYRNMKAYQDKANQSRERIEAGYAAQQGLPIPEDYDDYPEVAVRLLGLFEYSLPDGVL